MGLFTQLKNGGSVHSYVNLPEGKHHDPIIIPLLWVAIQYGQTFIQWIGLRENLQETIDFPIKYWV